MKEVTTMLSFDHPNVMSLIGLCLDRGAPLIIMPFMANGSVLEYLKKHKEDLYLTSDRGSWTRDIKEKVQYSASLGINFCRKHAFVIVN